MNPAERDALLAELRAYDHEVVGAQAILDEAELGARVADLLAAQATTATTRAMLAG